MGRTHTADEARHIILLSKRWGLHVCPVTLSMDIRRRRLQASRHHLTELMALGPSHISIYGLSVEPGTVLSHNLRQGRWILPTDDETGNMYDLIMDRLVKGGLRALRDFNFAKAGDKSRHNLVYWHYNPYLAFGAGATRFDGRDTGEQPGLSCGLRKRRERHRR